MAEISFALARLRRDPLPDLLMAAPVEQLCRRCDVSQRNRTVLIPNAIELSSGLAPAAAAAAGFAAVVPDSDTSRQLSDLRVAPTERNPLRPVQLLRRARQAAFATIAMFVAHVARARRAFHGCRDEDRAARPHRRRFHLFDARHTGTGRNGNGVTSHFSTRNEK